MNIAILNEHVAKYRADEYGRRIVGEAKQWSVFAKKHSSLSPQRVHNTALEAVVFTLQHGANHFSIPTKLNGTRMLQKALEKLHQSQPMPWIGLALVGLDGRIEVYWEASLLGWIWPRHTWLWPLLTVGVEARLIAITGTDADWKWLGCNVALTGVSSALAKLQPSRVKPAPPTKYPDFINQPETNGAAR